MLALRLCFYFLSHLNVLLLLINLIHEIPIKKNHILKNIEHFYFYFNNKLYIVISVLMTNQYTNLKD